MALSALFLIRPCLFVSWNSRNLNGYFTWARIIENPSQKETLAWQIFISLRKTNNQVGSR